MLDIIEQVKNAEEEQFQTASAVIQELLSAENMEAAIDEMMPYIDQLVMTLLAANIAQAEEQGAAAAANRLRQLHDAIIRRMQAAMPPQLVLIMKLAEAGYPDETRALLKENKELLDQDFYGYLEANIAQLESADTDDVRRDETLRHLRNVLTQARAGG